MTVRSAVLAAVLVLLALLISLPATAQDEALTCPDARPRALLPKDPQLCASLARVIRDPSALPLNEYEEKLGQFLRNFCHRDEATGWRRDKRVRPTGPFIATLAEGKWSGTPFGTHAPVVIWYSKEMIAWLHANRPATGPAPAEPAPVPDGAVMVKEMFSAPAADCAAVDPTHLLPSSGAAVMVRSRQGAHDGWFWGWFGWSGWSPDWPPNRQNRYPYMGFGQYCTNCHASAEADQTFASLRNVEGEPGQPLVFLSQHFFQSAPKPTHHELVSLTSDDPRRLGEPSTAANPAFDALFKVAHRLGGPAAELEMPSETYDNVWYAAGAPTAADQFVTSDQCLGCHDAGSTGLQFDMTVPDPTDGSLLLNLSPYATWRTSPMGLGGRDPVFFAQLASETESFHPAQSPGIQDVCLGCHGILGQRQFAIDHGRPNPGGGGGKDDCPPFERSTVNAVPWPDGNPTAPLADYGALARDGISCTACHHMLVGKGGEDPAIREPQNRCVKNRQDLLNPGLTGFASTFTGSFLVGTPDEIYGPFEDPKTKPMDNAFGVKPVQDMAVKSSELCGTCHTVHLPIYDGKKTLGYVYEQTTYPEWAFSAYRTGETPGGPLPGGAGKLAESCQSCHMPSKDGEGQPYRSKIASIQEYSNFPEADHNLGPEDVDLAIREGYARHTLVGLNLFFVEMAKQFPDILGIRTQDPMLVSRGLDPLLFTQRAMEAQASSTTADLSVTDVGTSGGKLRVKVTVSSRVGHKFPSGVGFRRAFLELDVLDEAGNVLWASGRSNDAGLLVDGNGQPLPGELWWKPDCSALLHPHELVYQPHYQTITRQDQAQIYQELVTEPSGRDPQCGPEAAPEGPFTTSFLSICGHVKDNRILPQGFLPLAERTKIAAALGAGDGTALAEDAGPKGVGDDPDYVEGGGDSLDYEIDLGEMRGTPAAVRVTLYSQSTPPYFLQDRFCTAQGTDTRRLHYLTTHLDLDKTRAAGWKFELVKAEAEVPAAGM